MRNRKLKCLNGMWKVFICYSSFNAYIICHSGYRPSDPDVLSLSSRTVRKYVLVLTLCRLGKCVVSSQLFGFPTLVEIHQQSHSGEEPREYKECGNSFVYPRSHCTCSATENVGNAIVFSFLQRCKKVPKGKRK